MKQREEKRYLYFKCLHYYINHDPATNDLLKSLTKKRTGNNYRKLIITINHFFLESRNKNN